MKSRHYLAAFVIAVFALSIAWQRTRAARMEDKRVTRTTDRIVSLAPSITEMLFALGLGDRVVGVTHYCDYPQEALGKKKIGGYYDPNYEAIVALEPDLVVLFPEHREQMTALTNMNLKTLTVNHSSVTNIIDSILALGRACGVEQRARQLIDDLSVRMESIRRKTENLPHPDILITLGRNMGAGSIQDAYIAGKDGYYHELITMAGGKNAYKGEISFPAVSREGIIRMNPEAIIDMIPDIETKGWDEKTILGEWQLIGDVRAVKNNRVYVFGEDYVVVPGPRFILLLEKMARVLHPEVDWTAI